MGFKILTGGSGQGPVGTLTGTTQSVRGSVTAPAAGAAIATTGNLAAGSYQVTVYADTSATDIDNMQLQVGATVIGPVPAIVGAMVGATFRVTVPAATAVTVNAIGIGTAGVVYSAVILWTPVV